MHAIRTIDIGVGMFILLGMVSALFLVVQTIDPSQVNANGTYEVEARFDHIGDLKIRAPVSLAGVTIGRVANIEVDADYGVAVVSMDIFANAGPLSADTGAKILTEGILGARYIGLLLGAEEEVLSDGDEIVDTQGALILENLIGDLVTRLGS